MTLKDKIFKLVFNNKFKQAYELINKNKDFNVNIFNDNYVSLSEIIINSNDIKLLTLLINRGIHLDTLDVDGHTLLYNPIKLNRIELIKLLLKNNEKLIGINILNIKDKYNNYPIHYCVKFNNLKILQLLIKYDINIIQSDIKGNNILHIAGYLKFENIIKYLVNNFPELYTFNNLGETILHIAIVNNLSKDILLLLLNNFDINLTNNEENILPIVSAIIEDNDVIFNQLDYIDIDYNILDYKGNNLFYHCIENENYRYFGLMFSIIKNRLNYNTVNIEGQTILHCIFNNIDFLKKSIKMNTLDILIKNTNLNIQDNIGNSGFLLLCKYDLWDKYYSIIETKPVNAFLQNKDGEKPIDFVKNNNLDMFYNLLTSSFFYYIQNKYKYIIDKEILNNCSKINDKCKIFIKDYIKNKSINTMPKNISYCHNIVDNDTSYVTFVGLQLDIFFGLLYLQNKFKKIMSTTHLSVFSDNEELIQFYSNNGISKSFEYELPNLEIKWTFQKLILPIGFDKLFKNNKIIIVPLGIILEQGSHSNMLFFNNKNKTVIRFEPYGSEYPFKFNYNPSLLDLQLEKITSDINPEYQYIPPKSYLQKISFQAFEISEDQEQKKLGDPGGFCAAWSLWFAENYLLNLDKIDNMSALVKDLILQIRIKNISFKNLIRSFASKISKYRDKFLKKQNIDINQWINETLTDIEYKNIVVSFEKL
jgi:ankyrin repeat protein